MAFAGVKMSARVYFIHLKYTDRFWVKLLINYHYVVNYVK
jgi:hypothetical protein